MASAGGCAAFTSLRDMSLHRDYGWGAASLAYTDGSPFGRVLKRLCTHRYCADTACMNRWIEDEVRRMPAQYLWVHKRFKTRPKGEPSLYVNDAGPQP